jgi:hypothetical protein
MRLAQSHSNYQAAIGTTTHYSADGSRPFQRALFAGYAVAGDLSQGGFFSENIMSAQDLLPSEAVSAWTGDAPHLNTMLSPNLRDVGAGVAISGGLVYYTLDAGLESGSPVSYTPQAGIPVGTPGTPIISQFILPVFASTPLEDGKVYHDVQFGQTLWSLAVEYKTTVQQIKTLNNLSGVEIYEGQTLLIAQLPTAAAAASGTATLAATTNPAAPTIKVAASASAEPSTPPVAPTAVGTGGGAVLAILVTAIAAAGLGTWISTRRPT